MNEKVKPNSSTMFKLKLNYLEHGSKPCYIRGTYLNNLDHFFSKKNQNFILGQKIFHNPDTGLI